MQKGARFISYSFTIPLPVIKKDSGRLVIGQAGELLVCCKARIAASLEDLPLAFADQKEGEIRITIQSIHYNGIDVLPIFNLPDAKALLESVNRAALNNLVHIQNY